MVEQRTENPRVGGSIPSLATSLPPEPVFHGSPMGVRFGGISTTRTKLPPKLLLIDKVIRQALPRKQEFKLFDGEGLFLLVKPNTQRGWRVKYRILGREKLLSFGPYPAVTLAKRLLSAGVDPSVHRQSANWAGVDSFEAVAREWCRSQSCRWAAGYSAEVLHRLERNVFPWIGHQLIRRVSAAELLACLRRIESRGTHETAHRVYQNVCWVFRHAVTTGRCLTDPSAALQGALIPT